MCQLTFRVSPQTIGSLWHIDDFQHRRQLTCDNAGAHLEVRLAWPRHCREGAAKERAASIVSM